MTAVDSTARTARWEIADVQAAVDAIRVALPGLRRPRPEVPSTVRRTAITLSATAPVENPSGARPAPFVPTRISGLRPGS